VVEEPPSPATQRKHALLLRATPLAGVWGLERFGLADASVLKLLEALPGKVYPNHSTVAI
jgi:hypothetical protein